MKNIGARSGCMLDSAPFPYQLCRLYPPSRESLALSYNSSQSPLGCMILILHVPLRADFGTSLNQRFTKELFTRLKVEDYLVKRSPTSFANLDFANRMSEGLKKNTYVNFMSIKGRKAAPCRALSVGRGGVARAGSPLHKKERAKSLGGGQYRVMHGDNIFSFIAPVL